MKKLGVKTHAPKTKLGHHGANKPRLRTRHLSTIGKSAFAGPQPDSGMPFPPSPGGGDAAFGAAPGAGPAPPPDAGAGALAGPSGGPPGM